MVKSLTEMAADIVAAQASHSAMSAEELEIAIKKTFDALKHIHHVEEGGQPPSEEKEESELERMRSNPLESIQKDFIINLEDGKKYRQLTANNLKRFGLTPVEYRKKWGIPSAQPLTAKSLTAARRKAAKKRGLPKKLQEYIERRRKEKAKP